MRRRPMTWGEAHKALEAQRKRPPERVWKIPSERLFKPYRPPPPPSEPPPKPEPPPPRPTAVDLTGFLFPLPPPDRP